MSERLQHFIAAIVARLAPVEKEANLAYWDFTTTGNKESEDRFTRLQVALRRIYADRAAFDQFKALTAESPAGDARLSRQVILLRNAFLGNQLDEATIQELTEREVAIGSIFNTFRADLAGGKVTENQIRDVLQHSDDPVLRRQAWEASKQIGRQVAGLLLELVELRNRSARQLGFDNYYRMQLTLQELDEDELFATLDELDRRVSPIYRAYKARLDGQLANRFGIAAEELRPWHYADPFFQEAPAAEPSVQQLLTRVYAGQDIESLIRRFYRAIGLDVDDILARSDLYERAGKQQHAYCTHIDRRGDVRVLANVEPNAYWMATMLHECGHAAYEKYLAPDLPYLLRQPAHTLFTEAVAMLMGRLAIDPDWMTAYPGVPADTLTPAADGLRWQLAGDLLIMARWVPVMSRFERALYDDPHQDLNRLWWDLEEQLQQVPRPEDRDAPDWAAKIHLSTAPVYYHNYLMGEMIASQLQYTLHAGVLGGGADARRRYVGDASVGRYLTEKVFRPGGVRHWEEALVFATGESLHPHYFVDQVSAVV